MVAITAESRSRRRLDGTSRPTAAIPTAGMADIAFLLIIFFVITTVQAQDRTHVNLPQSTIRTETDVEDAIVVITRDDGLVYKISDGSKPSELISGLDTLRVAAGAVVRSHPERAFQIKADGELAADDVGRVLDVLIDAGARQVVLLTDEIER